MMLKKLTGKTISLILAVLMIVTLMPLAASAMSDPASAGFGGNFSTSEIKEYSAAEPYVKGNFYAPITETSQAKAVLRNDTEQGGVVRILPTVYGSAEKTDGYAGIKLTNAQAAALDAGDAFTVKATLRTEGSSTFYMYLQNASKKYSIMQFWANGIIYACGVNTGASWTANTWYDITLTVNKKDGFAIMEIDGGAFDHARYSVAHSLAIGTECTSLGIGWLSRTGGAPTADSYFEIADLSIDTSKVSEKTDDSWVSFDNNNAMKTAISGQTAWSHGNWSMKADYIKGSTGFKSELVDGGDNHDIALKMTNMVASNPVMMNYAYTDVTKPLIVEYSYKISGNARMGLSFYPASSEKSIVAYGADSGYDGSFMLCGTTVAEEKNIPVKDASGNAQWVRVRVVLDYTGKTITLSHWAENNPSQVETVVDNTVLQDATTLTKLMFRPYAVKAEESSYIYIDDLRVYQKTAPSYTGSVPANNAVEVSNRILPEISFNMPLESTNGLDATLVNADNNNEAVLATVTLNKAGNGIMVTPNEELKPMTNYTLTVSGTATDIFEQTLNISKTISFTTDDIIDINSVAFTQGGVPVEGSVAPGELTATVDITSSDGEARYIFVLLGLYNKANGELEAFDVVEPQSTADYDETLTVSVPNDDGITYEPKVFIWNNYSGLKPYVAPITLD